MNALRTTVCAIFAFASSSSLFAHHGAEHETSAPTLVEKLQSFIDDTLAPADEEILDPDRAFRLTTTASDASTLVARWDIADGYYLYRDKFKFTVIDPPDLTTTSVTMPNGKIKADEFFGRMEVYYAQALATVGLSRTAPNPTSITVDIGYQGCADIGVCYPPMTKTITLRLPSTTEPTAPGSDTLSESDAAASPDTRNDDRSSMQSRLAHALTTVNLWLVLLNFFGFGALLAVSPSVLPMIPILASVMIDEGDGLTTQRAFSLSLIFVLAISATFAVAGATVASLGINLQIPFQNPWVLSVFAMLFVLLSLSMFGFYTLRIPTALRSRLPQVSKQPRGSRYLSVAVMGIVCAFITGPVVARPLANALVYVGQSGNATVGGLALFALGTGLGAPILVLGTSAARLLPKATPLMSTAKAVLGVSLVAVAIYLLEQILPQWVTLLLSAVLLVVCAIYMGALEVIPNGASGWRRLWKGAGLIMLTYGVLLMVGAAGGGGDLLQPLRGLRL